MQPRKARGFFEARKVLLLYTEQSGDEITRRGTRAKKMGEDKEGTVGCSLVARSAQPVSRQIFNIKTSR